MSRSLRSWMLCSLPVLLLACGPSRIQSTDDLAFNGSADFARGQGRDMASSAPSDLRASDPGSCLPLDTYCGYGGNFCVRTWTAAQMPASWCTAGKDVDIFVPLGDCTGGQRVIQLGGANFVDNKQFFYSMDSDGRLLGVVSISEGPTYSCDAEDASYASLMYSGCTYGPPARCVNGVIQ